MYQNRKILVKKDDKCTVYSLDEKIYIKDESIAMDSFREKPLRSWMKFRTAQMDRNIIKDALKIVEEKEVKENERKMEQVRKEAEHIQKELIDRIPSLENTMENMKIDFNRKLNVLMRLTQTQIKTKNFNRRTKK